MLPVEFNKMLDNLYTIFKKYHSISLKFSYNDNKIFARIILNKTFILHSLGINKKNNWILKNDLEYIINWLKKDNNGFKQSKKNNYFSLKIKSLKIFLKNLLYIEEEKSGYVKNKGNFNNFIYLNAELYGSEFVVSFKTNSNKNSCFLYCKKAEKNHKNRKISNNPFLNKRKNEWTYVLTPTSIQFKKIIKNKYVKDNVKLETIFFNDKDK